MRPKCLGNLILIRKMNFSTFILLKLGFTCHVIFKAKLLKCHSSVDPIQRTERIKKQDRKIDLKTKKAKNCMTKKWYDQKLNTVGI